MKRQPIRSRSVQPHRPQRRRDAQDGAVSNAETHSRDSSYQKPISLGGNYVLPLLSDMSESAAGVEPAAIVENFDEVIQSIGLTPEELQYLVANEIERIPRRSIHQHLNWSTAQVERTRKSLYLKLRKLKHTEPTVRPKFSRGSSHQLSYLEQMVSGHKAWSLAAVTCSPAFAEEMSRACVLPVRYVP